VGNKAKSTQHLIIGSEEKENPYLTMPTGYFIAYVIQSVLPITSSDYLATYYAVLFSTRVFTIPDWILCKIFTPT